MVRGQISEYIPNPTFEVVARPGAQEDYFRHGNPEGKSRREIFGEPMRAIPAFREPAPRLEFMDEQGIDRTLMFPTLASLVEERMRDDPEMIHAVVHALNEWLYETWQFNYEGRIFTTPVITLPIVEKAIEELEWVVERGARAVLIRPAPVPGLPGPRSFGLPEFDPFWEKVVEHDILVAHALVRQRLRALHQRLDGRATARCCRSSPTRSACSSNWRPVEDAVAALVCHGALSRFPQLKVAVIENGSSWVEPLLKNMADLYKKMPQDFLEDPVEVIKRNIYISPFWEEDLGALAELHRRGPRAVRLRLPPPRGPGRPGQLRRRARGAAARSPVRKIMGGNLARLMNVEDAVVR